MLQFQNIKSSKKSYIFQFQNIPHDANILGSIRPEAAMVHTKSRLAIKLLPKPYNQFPCTQCLSYFRQWQGIDSNKFQRDSIIHWMKSCHLTYQRSMFFVAIDLNRKNCRIYALKGNIPRSCALNKIMWDKYVKESKSNQGVEWNT